MKLSPKRNIMSSLGDIMVISRWLWGAMKQLFWFPDNSTLAFHPCIFNTGQLNLGQLNTWTTEPVDNSTLDYSTPDNSTPDNSSLDNSSPGNSTLVLQQCIFSTGQLIPNNIGRKAKEKKINTKPNLTLD